MTGSPDQDGGAGDDTLAGDARDNRLSGGAGDDVLTGGRGGDVLSGAGRDHVVNGGFETQDGTNDAAAWIAEAPLVADAHALARVADSLFGWTTPGEPAFELNRAAAPGSLPLGEGDAALDLAAAFVDGESRQIAQDVAGLEAGRSYRLTFEAARHPGAQYGELTVVWNGQVLLTVSDLSTAATTVFSFDVVAAQAGTGGAGRLEFHETGFDGDAATLIDGVRLYALAGGSDTADYGAETGGGGVVVNLSAVDRLVDGVAIHAGRAIDSFGDVDVLIEIDNARGTAADDTLFGTDHGSRLEGGGGDDSLAGGADADTLVGAEGDDLLEGGAGADTLDGGADADTLIGADGDDALEGGADADTLAGGTGEDILDGGAEADTLTGGAGSDTLIGGDGSDTAVFAGSRAGYAITLGPGGALLIRDTIGGGTDTVTGVEHFRFADGLFGLDSFLNAAPVLAGAGADHAATEQVPARLFPDGLAVADAELDALRGGAGDYAGATFSIARAGGADAGDLFGFDLAGAPFTLAGTALQANGRTVATVASAGGALTVAFAADPLQPATRALVQAVLGRITYAFAGDAPPAGLALAYRLSDGNAGAQGLGPALAAEGTLAVAIAPVNDAPVASPGFAGSLAAEDRGFALDLATGFRDADPGTILSLSATLADGRPLPAWLTLAGTVLSGTPRDADVGTLALRVTASDGAASASALFTLTVSDDALATAAPSASLAAWPAVEELVYTGLGPFTGTGNGLGNEIRGGPGRDRLFGLSGDDLLHGGDGADRLVGGPGRDVLVGGRGADVFAFDTIAESGLGPLGDVVTFVRAERDRIDLAGIDADTDGTRGNQAFAWVDPARLKAGFTKADGQLRFAGGVLMGDTDGDGRADFHIRIVGALAAGDVIL
ncbi:MAG TPA: putative Ig domain-containing protein [Microvirga sp.]|nr:putative Ig domain-containing protein [Microvirga sp.]